ncbi:hypothetical protein COOONC_08851, partial [Cooperia oncophora]
GNGYIPSYSVQTKTNYESGSQENDSIHRGSGARSGYSSNVPTYTTNFGNERYSTQNHATPAAQNYSYNNGVTTAAYKPSSGGTPLNQATFIQTSSLHSPSLQSSYLSPGGTRIYYHSPSPRTRRELAPNASIQHLQHRPSGNVYPVEATAQQHSQQPERPTE